MAENYHFDSPATESMARELARARARELTRSSGLLYTFRRVDSAYVVDELGGLGSRPPEGDNDNGD